MSESAGNFFIELSSIFDPKGFEDADKRLNKSNSDLNNYYRNLNSKNSAWGQSFSQSIGTMTSKSQSSMEGFFNFTSGKFLSLEALGKSMCDNIKNSFINALGSMVSSLAMSGLSAIFGGGGGFLGGLLGSRRTGGPIEQTGPYLLHAGEFVIPPELVDSIKSNRAPALTPSAAQAVTPANGSNINITINTPVNIQSTQNQGINAVDAKKLCEEISSAARRGVVWAVEQAKISYKIGKQKSGESAL